MLGCSISRCDIHDTHTPTLHVYVIFLGRAVHVLCESRLCHFTHTCVVQLASYPGSSPTKKTGGRAWVRGYGSVSILYYVNYRALQRIVVFMLITWSVGLDFDTSTFITLTLN